MKQVKIMFSSLMLMLLANFSLLADRGAGSWLAWLGVMLVPVAIAVFVTGALIKK